jgi:hypothetical protein
MLTRLLFASGQMLVQQRLILRADTIGENVKTDISQQHWATLKTEGYLQIPGAFDGSALIELQATVEDLLFRYPNGFVNPPLYSGLSPTPRADAPKLSDRAPTVIIPNVGFLAPDLLKPLANPRLHALLERIVGKDFYLSNTWFQMVPPGTGRLAYHKDPRGSVTFNILLDDIGPQMGSTCVVPGSHINTPPPAFCMDNIQRPHPREVDLTGKAGDLVLFSPEAWHGRSDNFGGKTTSRLFYNFYNRASRTTTAWDGLVSDEMLAGARAVLPPEYHHMFQIDPDRTRQLASLTNAGIARRWGLGASSSNRILRDAVYGWIVYGRAADNHAHPGFLLPYTTRLVEETRFSVRRYVSHFKPVPTAKNMVRRIQRRALSTVGLSRAQPAPAMDG